MELYDYIWTYDINLHMFYALLGLKCQLNA